MAYSKLQFIPNSGGWENFPSFALFCLESSVEYSVRTSVAKISDLLKFLITTCSIACSMQSSVNCWSAAIVSGTMDQIDLAKLQEEKAKVMKKEAEIERKLCDIKDKLDTLLIEKN